MQLRQLAATVALSFLALAGCAAPAADDADQSGSAVSQGDDAAPVTFSLDLDDDGPDPKALVPGGALALSARDANVAEVERQSDMGAATVEIGTLFVRAVPSDKAIPLPIEVRYSAKGNGALDVIKPSATDLAKVVTKGGWYSISAKRKTDGTSTFFRRLDLTITPGSTR